MTAMPVRPQFRGGSIASAASPVTTTIAGAARAAAIAAARRASGPAAVAARIGHPGVFRGFDDIKGNDDPAGDKGREDGHAQQSVRSDGVHDSLSF
ncbi:Hypothetical protein RG540_CH43330 [Neorhizobium galegae bv. orientalis str. HAMBI 540]|uniref:Uncharacterized protein n=1 Tax=Neorhizobium galegae bv. orientalis str. HAMBI 540 TaxID=1028800 RepID=A0A068SZA0_NEOGA|nr:Hypothetical protein RG540_CH43330 [Neorhizobium galegae bv. orientalis str. HAMBI 540]